MSPEIDPQTANAGQAESVPAPESSPANAAPAESAPAPPSGEPSQTSAAPGSEPGEGSKVVDELKAQRKRRQEAEQRVAYLEGQLEATKKPQEGQGTQRPKTDGVPNIDDYDDPNDYLVDKAKYELRLESQELKKQEKRAENEEHYLKRYNKAAEDVPDLHETIVSARAPMTPEIVDAIKESEHGPMIAYYFAKNPEEAVKLIRIGNQAALKEIGKMEERLESKNKEKPKPQITQAPEPIAPGGGAGGGKAGLDEMSMDEFIAARNAQEYGSPSRK